MIKFLLIFIALAIATAEAKAKDNSNEMVSISNAMYVPFLKAEGTTSRILPSYFIDKYPVTNQQYLNFVNSNPVWQKSKVLRLFADQNYLQHWKTDSEFAKEVINSPVVNVSWHAAKAYCEAQNKRLPFMDEWEYVATFDKGITKNILEWYGRPTPKEVPKIGSGVKNSLGVFDMHGLIWEWVFDFNTQFVTGESRADKGLDRNLFCGGGAMASGDVENYAAFMRFGFRSSLKSDYTVANLGFRCAKGEESSFPLIAKSPLKWPTNSLFHLGANWQDQQGKKLKLEGLAGKPLILAMMYTNCEYSCPMIIKNLKNIFSKLEQKSVAQFVLISYDAKRDEPDTLKKYAEKHRLDSQHWTLLHGDKEDIRELAATLGLSYQDNPKGDIMHSNTITVLTKDGVIHTQVNDLGSSESIVEFVKKLEPKKD